MNGSSHRARHVLAVLAVLSSACRDAATPPERGAVIPPRQGGRPASIQQRRDLELVHARNPHDWVGREHNRVLRKFASDLRKPGALSRSTCDYLLDLSLDTAGDARRLTAPPAQRRSAIHGGITDQGLCIKRTKNGSLSPVLHRAPMFVQMETELSSAAADLANRVLFAVETSESRYTLASALLPILDQAVRLDTIERAIVEATVSVAQGSYEFWEGELPAMQNQFYQDYSQCLQQAYAAGYPQDDARELCLNGGFNMATWDRPVPSLTAPRFSAAGVAARRGCGLADHYRRLAKADGQGAITGAIAGGKTGGWAAVLPGAFFGAIGASTAAFVKSTWEIFWCAM